jgi:hypothetical protein
MEDTWFSRELPVLRATVAEFERHNFRAYPDVADIAELTEFDQVDVAKALAALDGEYVDFRREGIGGGVGRWHVHEIFPEARRAVGQWPTPDNMTERLLAAIEEAADNAPDPETKGRLRKVGEYLGGATKEVVTKVMAEVIARQVGT